VGGWEQGQSHASCSFAGVLQGGAMTATERMGDGGGRDENFRCPSKKATYLLLHSLIAVGLRVLVSDPLRLLHSAALALGPLCPGFAWVLREPAKGVGDGDGSTPPPRRTKNTTRSFLFSPQAPDLVLSLNWRRWPSTPLSHGLPSPSLIPKEKQRDPTCRDGVDDSAQTPER
jgi:hypothetical protein